MYRLSFPIVALHWLVVAVLAASFLTGLRIAADGQTIPLLSALTAWLPQGKVFYWHLGAGLMLTALVAGYLMMQWKGQLGHRFHLPVNWRDRFATRTREKWRIANVLSYWLLLGVFLVTLITGLCSYVLPTNPFGQLIIERLHFALAWFYPVFVLIHVALHLLIGGAKKLLAIFLPRFQFAMPDVWAFATTCFFIMLALGLSMQFPIKLAIVNISEPPAIDGNPDDASWHLAPTITLLTSNGIHLDHGSTPITMQALHDKDFVYFLFQWRDATRSQKHLPLIKTNQGWRVVQTDFLRFNEDSYYEDKFALALARNPWAALTSIHLGPQPLTGEPSSRSERGLHFTIDNSIMDLWHWKSVRSNPNRQADDNYLGPPWRAPPQSPRRFRKDRDGNYPRFTAGYQKDPPVSWDGYAMNWEVFTDDIVKPRRLPKDPDDLSVLGSQNLSSDVSDDGDWWMEWNDTKPYMAEQDHYSVGTLLPGVLIQEPMAWDRGQITAAGTWHEGIWRLEMKRRLDTGSEFDIPIVDGTYAWVAVFDHTQTRHSRHLRPIKLSIAVEKKSM